MEYIVLIFARRITICLYLHQFPSSQFFFLLLSRTYEVCRRQAGSKTGRGRLASDCTMANVNSFHSNLNDHTAYVHSHTHTRRAREREWERERKGGWKWPLVNFVCAKPPVPRYAHRQWIKWHIFPSLYFALHCASESWGQGKIGR